MKKTRAQILIKIVLASLLASLVSITPASAVFGLSKCEKVKKEIIKYESDFNLITSELNSYTGKYLKGAAKRSYDRLLDTNLLKLMWKTAYNNQNCLTNTQKDYLPTLKSYKPSQFVVIDTGVFTKNSKFCKNSNLFLDECKFTDDDKIKKVYRIASIFDQ